MIFVEKSALGLPLTSLLEKEGADMTVIDDFFPVEDKKSNIVLTARKDNFVHACPGTTIYRCCNYHVADIMQGCPFDCAYCILQAYLPHKHIRVSADTGAVREAILGAIKNGKRRIGTGELSDSLALDNIIPLSKILMPIAAESDNIQFEFKTKSDRVENLLQMKPINAVVSWSLNPQEIIYKEEPFTASLSRRLSAARACFLHGYKLGFHFDPLIMTENFNDLYAGLIDLLAETVDETSVEFISVSTFRCPPELLHCMRTRKMPSSILKGDFIRALDGKARYFKSVRAEMLRFVVDRIRKHWKKVFIYLCMEHQSLWEKLLFTDPGDRESFEALFPCYKKI